MIGWGQRQRRKGQNEEVKNGIESENDDGAEDADDTEISLNACGEAKGACEDEKGDDIEKSESTVRKKTGAIENSKDERGDVDDNVRRGRGR